MKSITYSIIIFLFMSCGTKKIEPSSTGTRKTMEYIDGMIQVKMDDYRTKLPEEYESYPYVITSNSIIENTNTIVKKIEENTISESDMVEYKNSMKTNTSDRLYMYKYGNDFMADLELIDVSDLQKSSESRDLSLLKIKTIELMVIEKYHDLFSKRYMEVDILATGYDSKSDKIKLGETYEARLFVAAANSKRPFIFMVDGDTINTDKKNYIPVFKFKPDSKGKKVHQASVINQQYGQIYEFDIEYEVE